jgi:hypothetical protein
MKTLNWRHTDWNTRNFIFSIGQEIIGQLTFNGFWNFNAVYTDKETNLKFSQKSFWDRDVQITKDGKAVGEIAFGLFGIQTLKLLTGEKFTLSTSFWEQEVYWKNENGDTIINYQQATMSSMGKGLITLKDSLTFEMEKLLISSGLFARQLKRKRAVLFIAVMIPILAATRRL